MCQLQTHSFLDMKRKERKHSFTPTDSYDFFKINTLMKGGGNVNLKLTILKKKAQSKSE